MNLQEAIRALEDAVKEVARAALSDDMTPLRNALALREVASSVGAGGDNPDVVVFGDLNGFKSLNDQFGHATGDAAIGRVGQMVKELLMERCQAQAFRRSGDEFVILLSSSALAEFKDVTTAFASCSFQFENETRRTAMSFGYAISRGEVSFADLLSRAETACQVAKSRGDGACVEWTEEVERQAIFNLRDRCTNCGTEVRCNVPRAAVPTHRRLLWCPCCGVSFLGEEPPMQGA
jgi:diguanylate cyclase (GGDEF)-like protein